jgi:hypothetical protein
MAGILLSTSFRSGGSEGDLMRLNGWTTRAMVDRYADARSQAAHGRSVLTSEVARRVAMRRRAGPSGHSYAASGSADVAKNPCPARTDSGAT